MSEDDEESVFDSDEEERERNGKAFSDSEDDEELTAANMEALSAKLDSFAREDILAAQDEILNPVEPTADGVLLDTDTNEDLSSVRTRIMEIVRVLGNFKSLGEEGVKRKDYIEKLVSDVTGYYSYNEYLARKFLEMFSVAEVHKPYERHLICFRQSSFSKQTKFRDRSSSAPTPSKQPAENSSMRSRPGA